MKIFSVEQLRQADKITMERQGVESVDLMERAAEQLFLWMDTRLKGSKVQIHLFCGVGNNGGDGLALARLLKEASYPITVHVVNFSEHRAKDFLINLDRLKERHVWPQIFEAGSDLPYIGKGDIIVDAIFGIGLNRPPDIWVGQLIRHLNQSRAFVLSVDIPSGLFMDRGPEPDQEVVTAEQVLTFQVPKLPFFLPGTGVHTKQWEVMEIGLDAEYMASAEVGYDLVGKAEVLPWYVPREKFSHKGTYGHSLIVGGSHGKIGSVMLASEACLNAGSGLVTSFVPACGYIPLQTALPEVMVLTDINDRMLSDIGYSIRPTVVGLGVGIGQDPITVEALDRFLTTQTLPMVLDADALNICAQERDLLDKIPPRSVLTPHPKELQRLIGEWKDDFEKLEKAGKFAERYNCVLVIKGAHTITLDKGKGYVNTTGNPGMATAGSGDVLTGIITGLISQGYEPLRAAVFGVYLHGKAGDIAIEQCGYQALTASEIIDYIGDAYLDLFATLSDEMEG
ncbi:MAG: NAD(P)H-hydrate dehydratase [Sediminicola sp.]